MMVDRMARRTERKKAYRPSWSELIDSVERSFKAVMPLSTVFHSSTWSWFRSGIHDAEGGACVAAWSSNGSSARSTSAAPAIEQEQQRRSSI